jgi:hypothetical protein
VRKQIITRQGITTEKTDYRPLFWFSVIAAGICGNLEWWGMALYFSLLTIHASIRSRDA